MRDVFKKWGFEGELLDQATQRITSNKDLWASFMMSEELKVTKDASENPLYASLIVGSSSVGGSLIPLVPFFLTQDIKTGILFSIIFSAVSLFITGFVKAKVTIGSPVKSGIQMTLIGLTSALVGYVIGRLLGGVVT